MQRLEPQLGVLLLVGRSLLKDGGDLLKAVLLGLRCKIGVLVARLRFACKCGHEVLFGLAALEFHVVILLLISIL